MANHEQGYFKLKKGFFEVRKSLNQVLNMMSVKQGQRNIQFQFYCSSKVPDFIYSDMNRIKQVLYQLITNSLKFTTHGYIAISLNMADELPLQGKQMVFQRQHSMKEKEIDDNLKHETLQLAKRNISTLQSVMQDQRSARRPLSSRARNNDDRWIQSQRSRLTKNDYRSNVINHNNQHLLTEGGTGGPQQQNLLLPQTESLEEQKIQTSSANNTINFHSHHHMNNNGEQLSTYRRGNQVKYLKLDIEDTGDGINERDFQRVFSIFKNPKFNMHLTKHTGIGIGLSFCKMVCEELGGSIHLSSKQNYGTKFSCFFNITVPEKVESPGGSDEDNDDSSSFYYEEDYENEESLKGEHVENMEHSREMRVD